MPRTHLTRRERQVIDAIVRGRTNLEIARELDISEQTVKNHLSCIFQKLHVRSRLELALTAVKGGLITPDRG